MVTITISDIIFGLSFIVLICLIHKNLNLKKIISKYKDKNPVEIDLELATYSQIIGELRNRSLQYIIILPQFDKVYLNNFTVESFGLSQKVMKDVMTKVCFVISNGDWYKQEEQE
jgi:hypothetical protein